MKKIGIKILLCGLALAYAGMLNAQNKEQITIESLLKEMVNRDAIARFPKSDFRLKQQSSYNRASKTPQDTVGWFDNKDNNTKETDHNFIRTEENNGQKEWVLMEDEGAGAIVRTWMPFRTANKPETDIQIKIYLDGSNRPVLEGNMLGLLNGTGLFPYPFAHKSLKSAVSFFPIPYAKSCKITTTGMPFFYQFTYQKYPIGTAVKTFSMADFNKVKPLIEQVGKTLVSPQEAKDGKEIAIEAKLDSKKQKSIELPKGNAAVRNFSIKLSDYKDPSITRSVIVKMEFDGEQTVWCPIGDFFGTGIGLNPFKGWYTTVDEDGIMSARWVMPYQKTGKITIENLSETAVNIQLKAKVGAWKWDEQSMYFNAAWRGQYPVATRPYSDWNYITLKGRGVYVGDALTVMNPVARWWGEGDEKIWVDNENFPSIFGTGTEDYYGYSWGGQSNDFYEHPFHAQPRSFVYNKLNRKTSNDKNTLGYSTETRTRSLDTMPFGSALKLDMEIWSWTDCNMGYGVGVYWYGDKNIFSNRKPDPKGALVIPPLPAGFPNQPK
ncbi:hypothetical protein ADIARSV_2182 [Arcticibacter svalbardensis MN12-7]|uniref:DUF2961 domain-containing protein n=1 Tax=Arcticibacter svalbardensis MN12-7 TaxID=1150600 RepID=R9H031_9SPHI|nr:glycoside hydrolase family 172 protein [Arcticibacter svalbardensis]EOR94584.1 hypothetical protein ADIARSV_2182 [Arcticibacter svalbardensis MN12-7]